MKRRYIHDAELGLVEVFRQAPRPRVAIHGDSIELRSMADGNFYTSKSRYLAEVKARGLEVVGNERSAFEPPAHKSDGLPELRQVAGEMGL